MLTNVKIAPKTKDIDFNKFLKKICLRIPFNYYEYKTLLRKKLPHLSRQHNLQLYHPQLPGMQCYFPKLQVIKQHIQNVNHVLV